MRQALNWIGMAACVAGIWAALFWSMDFAIWCGAVVIVCLAFGKRRAAP